MKLQNETNWRIFFKEDELHQTISHVFIFILGKALDHGQKSNFISKNEYNEKIEELLSYRASDIGLVEKAFFINCNLLVRIPKRDSCKLINLLRAIEDSDCDYYKKNRNKVLNAKWRVSEARAICGILKEARNVQSHNFIPRLHLGWLLMIPSTILRLLEICPDNDKITKSLQKLYTLCNEQIDELLAAKAGQRSDNRKEEIKPPLEPAAEILFAQEAKGINSKLDSEAKAINTKLDNIVAILSNATAIEGNKSELQKQVVVDDQEITYEDEEQIIAAQDASPEVDLLTPHMMRNELSYLAKNHSDNYEEFIFGSPAENLLQVAIIDEILSGRPKKASEILTLPDVAWRYKEHKKSMKKQFDVLKPSLENILNRAEWDE